jgi:preprotein translocase subunit SecE
MKERAVRDERDSADAAGGAGENPARLIQPLRPTGKPPRHSAGATALADHAVLDVDDVEEEEGSRSETAVKKAGADGPNRNPFVFVWTYLRQVVAEMRKVIWPNRKQMVSYTAVVLAFLVFMVALIGLVDLGLAKLVLLTFGNK